ncbi:MAG: regulatory protein RecX [Fusobacteriaceae bacterium]
MMIYYKIVKNKIFVENGVEFTVSGDIISKFELKKKEFLQDLEYEELLEIACENYVYYLLNIKNYFKKDLEIKLQQRYKNKRVVLRVLEKIDEKGYMDDYDSAQNFILTHKNYGTEKLRFYLARKGISKELVDELLEQNKDSQLENLRKIILKMNEKPKEKVIESLMRKGFSYIDIKNMLNEQ